MFACLRAFACMYLHVFACVCVCLRACGCVCVMVLMKGVFDSAFDVDVCSLMKEALIVVLVMLMCIV